MVLRALHIKINLDIGPISNVIDDEHWFTEQ